jgi:lysophospholipase L1-like esterase
MGGAGGMGGAGSGGAAGTPMAGTGPEPDAGSGGSGSGAYEPCPPAGQVCKILPLGDSITYGIGYDGGYRVELFRKAHSAGKQITFTGSLSNGPSMVDGATFPKKNEGHSGQKIAQLNPLIPDPALKDPPNIILLMIGTNDIAQSDDLANAPKRLGALIDLLIKQVPDALIVVTTITPLGFGGGGVTTFNDALPGVVNERAMMGKHVVLVDQYKGFPTSELGDGVHPNQQGYERMAGVWYAAIADVLH